MSGNLQDKKNDIRTLAYVLKRTNYGEADRILNLITPVGKISAIAKGVRKEKSKLAGNIEMFSLIDMNIHFGRGNLAVITSAKMLEYYNNLLQDFEKLELAGLILKKVSLAAEHSDNAEFFEIINQSLKGLQDGVKTSLVEVWAWFRLAKASGEEVNLYFDTEGEKLREDERYSWDQMEMSLAKNPRGNIGADEIKMMRLLVSADLEVVARVKNAEIALPEILQIARAVNRFKK